MEVAEMKDGAALIPRCNRAGRTKAQPAAEKSATTVDVPEHTSFIPIPTGCIAEEPGDSCAEEPIVISSEEGVGVTLVVKRLPANQPSGDTEERMSPDTVRQHVLVRLVLQKSPLAVAAPSLSKGHPEEEEHGASPRRGEKPPFFPQAPMEVAVEKAHDLSVSLCAPTQMVPGLGSHTPEAITSEVANGVNRDYAVPAREIVAFFMRNMERFVQHVMDRGKGQDLPVYLAPGGHVSPEMEQVSSPGSASSTLLEEHHGDEDDEYDEDDATEETEIQSCDHEEVPIETVVPPNRPSTSTYDAIVASEGKIVDAENRRHSDMMTVLERMIGLQEETVSQLAHLHRVFIEVPKQLQKINTSFEALVVQQTQANYWRMTNVPQFNTSQPGSVHAGQFSPHSSDIHSPGPNVTGQVADIAVQVPDDILPLPSVQIQQQTPTKEATKTKQDTHETDQPSLVQCLPTCSHVSLGTSPVREQSLPKSPVGESLPKSTVGESLPKSPVGESLPKSPVGESLPKSPVGESLPKSPVGESLPKSPVGESLPKSPVGESLATSPVGESLATSPVGEQSLATSPAREVPEATQSGSVVPKVGGKRKRKIQETTSRPVTRSQKEQKK
ncbi:uncharacterized protein LOC142494630 [Ascaphus truei]|uniref:uncharacterized protein LOC142494630 n=1 Tax=Ascaphus truei TaxID=8439 RepID=UPI003F5A5D1A